MTGDERAAPNGPTPECQPPGVREISFGYPGDGGLGDRLLAGHKTATSSLAVEYLDGIPLPRVGEEMMLTDHDGQPYGVVRTTGVQVMPLSAVGDDVAVAEGEGFTDAQHWREVHLAFWRKVTADIRAASGDPRWVLREDEPVVVEWFQIAQLSAARSPAGR